MLDLPYIDIPSKGLDESIDYWECSSVAKGDIETKKSPPNEGPEL